jgi:hypothetical protein
VLISDSHQQEVSLGLMYAVDFFNDKVSEWEPMVRASMYVL